MKLKCPKKNCQSPKIYRFGRYFRSSDSRWIQRYKCSKCRKYFSKATFDDCYRQKKRRINEPLKKLLCSSVSQRRAAIILGVTRKTIERRARFLGKLAKKEFTSFWSKQEKVLKFQFDDLETIEHTKLKPLSVTVAVASDRRIMEIQVSQMPAKGHLARISRKKYGYRKDKRIDGLEMFFNRLKNKTSLDPSISSDKHPYYLPKVKKHYPTSEYFQTKGGRGCVAGQGELKKLNYDPLFTLNHTFAMFRANINRLVRKTWCSTKKPERLLEHLYLYANFHNKVLIK